MGVFCFLELQEASNFGDRSEENADDTDEGARARVPKASNYLYTGE